MKNIARLIAINSLSLFLTSLFLQGLNVSGEFMGFVIAGALIAATSTILDPIVKIVTLPFNILTLGLLSFLTTLVSLYIVTFFYSGVKVHAFIFEGLNFAGVSIQRIELSGILSFVAVSATIYLLGKAINLLFTR